MNDTSKLEPWQWPEEHWRGLVNQVRAGETYRPRTWKGGARCAFALSFDSDHETNELRDGGKSIGRMAWGQYGNRVGVPNILKLLAKHSVPATFYVPAVCALLYPDEQRRIIAEGPFSWASTRMVRKRMTSSLMFDWRSSSATAGAGASRSSIT